MQFTNQEALIAVARKLPQGPDRQNALQQIGKFRKRIIAFATPRLTARAS
jgi:hypothetical protein